MDVLMMANGIGVNKIVPVIMITDSGARTIITVPIQIITSISINHRNREMTDMTGIKDPISGETAIAVMKNAMTSVIKTNTIKIKKRRKKRINDRKVNVPKFIAEAKNILSELS